MILLSVASLLFFFRHPVNAGFQPGTFRIVFYNVENLFDTVNDPCKDDDEFTPQGSRRWNSGRLNNKIRNLSGALVAAGGWDTPALIGLCEVENISVLEMLISSGGLSNSGYRIIHRNSADRRGIDVAVLYRPEQFTVLDTLFKEIRFPFDTLATTRDILYVRGLAGIYDTLHVFINHWPSRWGGQAATEPYRNHAASALRLLTDSVFNVNPLSAVVIMGDFNDEPDDISLKKFLGAGLDHDNPVPGKLYNLSSVLKKDGGGTLKYQGVWFIFDQFIVSGSLLDQPGRLQADPSSVRVLSEDFLLVPDQSWFGFKPFRTYEGFRHTGGFSDHLPVIMDLRW